jgi:hypothetical protein
LAGTLWLLREWLVILLAGSVQVQDQLLKLLPIVLVGMIVRQGHAKG